MRLPGVAMLLAMFSGVIVVGREVRERARTGPAAEVRNRHARREAALAEAASPAPATATDGPVAYG